MIEKIVIGFVGLPGAGKTVALESVLDLGEIATLGNVVRQEADSRNLLHTDENLGLIGKELRKEFGEDIVARRLVEIVKAIPTKVIFIDGLRSMFEVEIFRNYWKFPIIAFVVDDKLRHERLMERGREDDSLNIDDLKERDNREINYGLLEVIENANYKINNNGTIEELQKKTRTIVELVINDLSSSL